MSARHEQNITPEELKALVKSSPLAKKLVSKRISEAKALLSKVSGGEFVPNKTSPDPNF